MIKEVDHWESLKIDTHLVGKDTGNIGSIITQNFRQAHVF